MSVCLESLKFQFVASDENDLHYKTKTDAKVFHAGALSVRLSLLLMRHLSEGGLGLHEVGAHQARDKCEQYHGHETDPLDPFWDVVLVVFESCRGCDVCTTG